MLIALEFKWKIKVEIFSIQRNGIYSIFIIFRRIMTAKKKAQLTSILDDLRSEDAKKRLASVTQIRQIAAAIGPQRARTQFLNFLAEFVDDEEAIVMELLTQLENFTPLIGGPQHDKCLIPLLISFCKTDQKKLAFRACALISKILQNNKDIALDTIKKLAKTEMSVAKQISARLISTCLGFLQNIEPALFELYYTLLYAENQSYKIIGAKYMQATLKIARNKDQIGKMLQLIYNQNDDLVKIYALGALIDYYDINNNLCLTKFKNLSLVNSWRINMKICEQIPIIFSKMTKAHFKLIFEPLILKFMTSTEPQLRAACCPTLGLMIKHLADEQIKNKFIPALKKLAQDTVEFVKVDLSKNLIGMCQSIPPDLINQAILPIVYGFVKETNCQISLGVMKGFDYLSSKIGKEVLQEKIIKPLTQQFTTQSWRLKCQIIDILKNIIHNPAYLSQPLLKVIFNLTDDKVDAVRLKANELIIGIITKQSKDWTDNNIIPRITIMRESPSYIKRQNLLEIIEKTAGFVSDKTLKEVYQNTVIGCLTDKVPNVRLKSAVVIKNAAKISNPTLQKTLDKLKDDKDIEIRDFVKKLRA